ncbi:MAG: type II toxin-antitoxin system PemK/MazF family toxin [Chloroflexota bacterium]|nr:type II toxin-antitoxin system PemK/MazF family toxin [Chloroflexota bacterium]
MKWTTISRSAIWLVDFDPTRGAEIQKTRPTLVVNVGDVGRLRLRIVIPITNWNLASAGFSWMVRIEPDNEDGLSKISGADTFQVTSVSEERFVRRIGSIIAAQIDHVAQTIAICIGCTSS